MSDNQIIMLGTGHATVTRCYNTCFVLKSGNDMLLADAGGGNGILSQLKKAHIDLADIHDMFITHAHTDHILGAVWIVRMVIQRMKNNTYDGCFSVYSHDKSLNVLDSICRSTLHVSYQAYLGKRVFFHEVKDADIFNVGDMEIQCFDIKSAKEKQFGFRAILPDGQKLVCLGDEPYNEANRLYAENADWLMCEAFCLYADREIFKPYEKQHSTALEAGIIADKLNAGNLLLYHTEDKNLPARKSKYTAEASQNFKGNIYVPDDLDVIDIA